MKIILLAVLALLLVGCALFTQKVDDDGNPIGGSSPVEKTLGPVLSLLLPWGAALLTTATTVVNQVAKKKYFKAAGSVARGIEEVRLIKDEDGMIKISEENLMRTLSAVQDEDGTRDVVRKVVANVIPGPAS